MRTRLTYRPGLALCSALGAFLAACSAGAPPTSPGPAVDTVVVEVGSDRVPALQQRVATLRFQLFERDARMGDLQRRLEAARQETVRAMARVQTSASRAEAASVMAEAEIALQALAGLDGDGTMFDEGEARALLELSATAFAAENYGGALYLAIQARGLAREGELRISRAEQEGRETGETIFAVPVRLKTTRNSNVREGPGTGYPVVFTLGAATPIQGGSYSGLWVHITDGEGRRGWIFHDLVTGAGPGGL